MHALVIDDSRVMRSILRTILKQQGFTVTEAGDGQAGLEALQQLGTPSVVLVDWNMPVMDGLAFVRAVRADPRYRSLRLLMITTETETSRMMMALEAGADEYVMKPFTREIIQEKLQMLGVLPTQDDPGAAEIPAEVVAPQRKEGPMRALVIDDSRVTRMILRQILGQLGYEVSEAADGLQGLAQLQGPDRAELVMVDANMPEMDGFAFLAAVRAEPTLSGLRLVMITGEEDPLSGDRAAQQGAGAFLRKPFTRETVQESLQRVGIARQ